MRESAGFGAGVERLPPKYRSAILAAEIATSLVYRGGTEPDFERALEEYVAAQFA